MDILTKDEHLSSWQEGEFQQLKLCFIPPLSQTKLSKTKPTSSFLCMAKRLVKVTGKEGEGFPPIRHPYSKLLPSLLGTHIWSANSTVVMASPT